MDDNIKKIDEVLNDDKIKSMFHTLCYVTGLP